MNNEEETEEPLVCGVPRASLERFLIMIRDGYPKAELATVFLEVRAGISNVPNMANVRDALSHLATFLDPALDPATRAEQVSYAEEHLRRAIIEPYQVAVDDFVDRIEDLYDKYKASLLPVRDRHPSLNGAPNDVQVNARLRVIEDAVSIARKAKGRNRWDEEWENGVKSYVIAFDSLKELHAELEGYWFRFEQIRADAEQARVNRHHTQLHIGAIAIAVATFFLGFGIEYLSHRLGWW